MAGRIHERKSERQNAVRREASFSLIPPPPPLPLSSPKSCSMWRGKQIESIPLQLPPRGLGGTFWKVIPAHCGGLKCCHAKLVPNCSASDPHPTAPAPAHQQHTKHTVSTEVFFKDMYKYIYTVYFYLGL